MLVNPARNGEFVRELAWALLDPTGTPEPGALLWEPRPMLRPPLARLLGLVSVWLFVPFAPSTALLSFLLALDLTSEPEFGYF